MLRQCLDENPGIRGIMLGSHGLFTWGDTAYESYMNTLELLRYALNTSKTIMERKVLFSVDKNSVITKRRSARKGRDTGPDIAWLLLPNKNDRSLYR